MKLCNISEITHLAAESNYTHIHYADGSKIMSSYTLKNFEPELLEKGFKRIHKSYLINEKFVSKKDQTKTSLKLFTGQILPVARRRRTL